MEIQSDAENRAMIKLANSRDALIVQLLAESGLRVGELVALRVQDLVEQDVVLLDGRREHQVGVRVVAGKGLKGEVRAHPP